MIGNGSVLSKAFNGTTMGLDIRSEESEEKSLWRRLGGELYDGGEWVLPMPAAPIIRARRLFRRRSGY